MSEIISVRVNKLEKEILAQAAAAYNGGISSMIKKIVFEKLEDEYDLQLVEDYETRKDNHNTKLYNHEDAWKELGL